MKRNFTLLLMLTLVSFSPALLAQCPSSGGPFCYSATSTQEVVAVDLCPTAGMAVQVTFTAGQVENNFDELQVFCGPAGSGTGGTQLYNAYGTGGDLTGVVVACAVANDCISIYINSDVSVTCATNGFTPITYDIVCIPASCSGTVPACYGNNGNQTLLLEICPDAGFSQVDIEFLAGEMEVSFDDLFIYSGATGTGATGTQLAADLDGDLTGLTYGGLAANDCISLIYDSDGSVSCVSSTTIDAMTICVESSVPLPISLVSFDAFADKNGNMIVWETASEYNTEQHIVERSANGVNNWTAIGAIGAAGYTSSAQQYKLMDEKPLTESYYRLRSVDYDGSDQLSPVVNVKRAGERFSFVKLFPIPVTNELTVQYETVLKGAVTYSITNTIGQVMAQQQLTAERGLNSLQIDMSQLSDGLYFISIDNGNERIVEKILK